MNLPFHVREKIGSFVPSADACRLRIASRAWREVVEPIYILRGWISHERRRRTVLWCTRPSLVTIRRFVLVVHPRQSTARRHAPSQNAILASERCEVSQLLQSANHEEWELRVESGCVDALVNLFWNLSTLIGSLEVVSKCSSKWIVSHGPVQWSSLYLPMRTYKEWNLFQWITASQRINRQNQMRDRWSILHIAKEPWPFAKCCLATTFTHHVVFYVPSQLHNRFTVVKGNITISKVLF